MIEFQLVAKGASVPLYWPFFTLSRLLKFWKVGASWVKNRFDAIRIPSPQSGAEVTH